MRLTRGEVESADESFSTSGVALELQLAAFFLPDYLETSFREALNQYSFAQLGQLSLMHYVRDRQAVQADFVALVMDGELDPMLCGQALALHADASKAFFLVARRCLSEQHRTFAHETGHLLGADHDPANAPGAPFSYGHGFLHESATAPERWGTIMAFDCAGGCTRISAWSTPLREHNGVITGTPLIHDNARVLNETKSNAAAFRPDPT